MHNQRLPKFHPAELDLNLPSRSTTVETLGNGHVIEELYHSEVENPVVIEPHGTSPL